ncbi:DUF6442 family protein [Oceanivirga salmonicida]|uniref:DUF6442 family protein n=1 Tax=Oceanivirga salmonicida TaxID=1769291 RepID=UPI0012E12D57|nr:DUF6442 family protein [Oceanivirga salmonicida]
MDREKILEKSRNTIVDEYEKEKEKKDLIISSRIYISILSIIGILLSLYYLFVDDKVFQIILMLWFTVTLFHLIEAIFRKTKINFFILTLALISLILMIIKYWRM